MGFLNRNSRIASIAILLASCNLKEEVPAPRNLGPKIAEARGHVVPADSMATPKVIVIDESKLKIIPAGNPRVILTNTNIHPAGHPKVMVAGKPRICTPGQDTFPLPKSLPAIDSPFLAGIPEVVLARDPDGKDQNPQNFISFGKLQGLKDGPIQHMIQDRAGHLWFASNGGGACRYDGKSFTHYTAAVGLSNNVVNSILEDRAGNLWFATMNGVSRYDGKLFTHFTTAEGLPNNNVYSILEDRKGSLWFATNGGVGKYDGISFVHFTTSEGLPHNDVWSAMEDRAGNLWFGTRNGASKYDGHSFANFTTAEGLSNNDVNSILEDKIGNFWFATHGGGVSRYDGKTFSHFTTAEGLSNDYVLGVLEDQSGNLWFSTNGGGISRYDGKTFAHFTTAEGLPNNDVWSALEDRSGNLWFGTIDGSASRYDGKTFTHFTTAEGLSNNDVLSILEDRSGNFWFGTYGGGVSRNDGESYSHFSTAEGIPNDIVNMILEDRAGNFWFCTNFGGAVMYTGNTFTHFTTANGLIHNSVYCILEDRAGNLWFGTYGGVSRYDGKTFTQFTTTEGLSKNSVSSMLEDRAGNLWFGGGHGVSKYDGKTFTHFTTAEGLSHNTVLTILEDPAGNLWFGTNGGGVNRYDGKTFTHFTTSEGLPDNAVFSSLTDRAGNLWFGTPFGLSKLSNEKFNELNTIIKPGSDPESGVLFKNYVYEDGFLGIGCNRNALYEDRSGTIWIGTNDRLTAYHPPLDSDTPDTVGPNIQLNAVMLYNEAMAWPLLEKHKDSTLTLGNGVQVKDFQFNGTSRWYGLPEDLSLTHNNNSITFSFIGLTMSQPHKVKYKYKLEGNDANWSELSLRTEATYGNLPHGSYTFKVSAVSGEGYWSDEFHYPFTIRPPWWLTWWAYSVYALGMITGIWRLHNFQQARTLRLERERTQARELAQAKEIEKAYTELKATQKQLIQSEKMASLGELTAGIAHEIQNPLNFVNNFSDLNKELLSEMKEVLGKGDMFEVEALANDIIANEEKINHHGKRADAIVKSMLQHSRSSGVKVPTDINTLADEYLRLAYHGLRAKDKSFNADFELIADPALPKVDVVPQDIGRVLLNLVNNAFYAVTEKQKSAGAGFRPVVRLTTSLQNDQVIVRIMDNGPGISPELVDKIFQPFFTTKPTGQGTGLGLSISYDIVTKGHHGMLSVVSEPGESTTFMISLPVNTHPK